MIGGGGGGGGGRGAGAEILRKASTCEGQELGGL